MLYRTLGRTGEKVSAIGVGGWHLARVLAPKEMRDAVDDQRRVGGASLVVDAPGAYVEPDPYDTDRR